MSMSFQISLHHSNDTSVPGVCLNSEAELGWRPSKQEVYLITCLSAPWMKCVCMKPGHLWGVFQYVWVAACLMALGTLQLSVGIPSMWVLCVWNKGHINGPDPLTIAIRVPEGPECMLASLLPAGAPSGHLVPALSALWGRKLIELTSRGDL